MRKLKLAEKLDKDSSKKLALLRIHLRAKETGRTVEGEGAAVHILPVIHRGWEVGKERLGIDFGSVPPTVTRIVGVKPDDHEKSV